MLFEPVLIDPPGLVIDHVNDIQLPIAWIGFTWVPEVQTQLFALVDWFVMLFGQTTTGAVELITLIINEHVEEFPAASKAV